MGSTTTPMPFELAFGGGGAWQGYWAAEKVGISVGGTTEAPTAQLLATMKDVISRWSALQQLIATFVRRLAPDHLIALDPPGRGGFAAGHCGFDGPLMFQSIAVEADDSPHRVVLTFYTGYPDGYASFEVVLERGAPIAISAFAS